MIWFLFAHSTLLIPALVTRSHSFSTESTTTSYQQSTAKNVALHSSTSFFSSLNNSLKYITNRICDTGEPCGTPVSTLASVH